MNQLKCCGLCKQFRNTAHDIARGVCLDTGARVYTISQCHSFDHVDRISIDMFAYLAQQVPPQTQLPELCELLGIEYRTPLPEAAK